MTDPFSEHPASAGGPARLIDETARAAEALQALASGPGLEAATALERAFAQTGRAISASFARAARDGEISLSDLAATAVATLSRIGFDRFVAGPLSQVINGLVGQLPFMGARAGGGPVTAGGAYLVGEHGPEMFVPPHAGDIRPQIGSGGMVVHLHLPPGSDAAQIARSEQQIAAALARAALLGQRSL